ncbi:MAG: homoserine dehydrogenase [Planctomycetes bacterium]|nr:homoserine dehydrogenase [Planctomycetota bacterium]
MAESVIGVGMIGCGTVGGGVATLLREMSDVYARRAGTRLELRRVLVRDAARAAASGLVDRSIITNDAEAFFETPGMSIVVEVAGGRDVSRHVRRAITSGKHIVTANKTMLAAEGDELFALARKHSVSIAFEASCGGGIPIITAMQFGLMANRIEALYGILNGTCNYILTEMVQKDKPYAVALKEAQELGFAEADPTLDVSGRDAAQKLAVLASLAFGAHVTDGQVPSEGIDTLDLQDIRFAGELGYTIKLLAIAEREGFGRDTANGPAAPGATKLSLRVQPCFVHKTLPLAQVNGSYNALSVYGHANGHTMYYGRGAGRMPTASAVVSDLLNVASGWYPQAFSRMRLWCDSHEPVNLVDPGDLESRFYLRINALDVPGVMGKVSTALGEMGISISAILQHEAAVGKMVPVVITTHRARRGALMTAMDRIEKLDVIGGRPVAIRIVDMPQS